MSLLLTPTNFVRIASAPSPVTGGYRSPCRHFNKSFFFTSGDRGVPSKSSSDNLLRLQQRSKSISCQTNSSASSQEEEEFQVLTSIRSKYNEIMVLDTPTSRFLLLDSTHNVHSLLDKGGTKWTGSYWDEFSSLPAIVPEGPIAIYGLGGGTAAHLMLDLWPSLQLEGWEIDEILIDKAREFLELSDIEKPTHAGGRLVVYVDDALSPSRCTSERYAGIIIDLFSDGKVLSELQEVTTWLKLIDRLMPNGRLMVNCGGIDLAPNVSDEKTHVESADVTWMQNSTVKALSKAFPGQLSWKLMAERQGQNFLALTGPLPDLTLWSTLVPSRLGEAVKQWKPCQECP